MKKSRMKALESLRKLQKIEVDQARAVVVTCLAEEEKIEGLIARGDVEIRENTALISTMQGDDHHSLTLRSGYRQWLPTAQEQLKQHRENLLLACQHTEDARADMAKAKIALEATLKLQKELQKEYEIEKGKRQQSEIDDWAQRLGPKNFL